MSTPRSNRHVETSDEQAEEECPSSVMIGMSNMAGVPADLASYVWDSREETGDTSNATETRSARKSGAKAPIVSPDLASSSAVAPATAGSSSSMGTAEGEGHKKKKKGPPRHHRPGRQPGARFALGVLTLINLLNYVDRWVVGQRGGGRTGRARGGDEREARSMEGGGGG
ncbi:hypothetical protein Naga_100920g2, partial [Nannochloropsis gaditana]